MSRTSADGLHSSDALSKGICTWDRSCSYFWSLRNDNAMDLSENGEITPITIRPCQEGTWCSPRFPQFFRQTQKWLVLPQNWTYALISLAWLIYVLMHLYIMFSKLSKLFQEFWATVTLVAVWPKLTEVPLLAVNFSLLVDRKPEHGWLEHYDQLLVTQRDFQIPLMHAWLAAKQSGTAKPSVSLRIWSSTDLPWMQWSPDVVQRLLKTGRGGRGKKGPNTKTLLVWKMTHWLFAKKGNGLWLSTWLENPATTLKPWNSLVIFQPACLDCHSWSVLGTNCH